MLPRAALLALASALAAAPLLGRATFPLVPGEAVATCGTRRGPAPGPPHVAGILDIRNPGCDPAAAPGQNWLAPMYHNELPNPTSQPGDEWTDRNLGPVFGVELDDAAPPNIYLSATSAYGDLPASGRVWKLDGSSGAPAVFATLPQGSLAPGLGNLAWDPDHQLLFATSMEDGKVHRIDASGVVLDSFDPFAPDDGADGFAPLGERLWALAYHEGRLYFSVWTEDQGRPDPLRDNTVWSVAVDPATGGFVPADLTLEISLPALAGALHSNPVADLSFAPGGRLALAERTMTGDSKPDAHGARLLEYLGSHRAWTPSPRAFLLGQLPPFENSAGGADWDCAVADACNGGQRLWGTGDALRFDTTLGIYVYGAQGTPAAGGSYLEGYLVDFNGDTALPLDKTLLGDIDVYRPRCRVRAEAGPPLELCGPERVILDGSASFAPGCAGPLEYRWLQGVALIQDWSAIPSVGVSVAATTLFRVEVRCAGTSCGCEGFDEVLVRVEPPPGAALAAPPRACPGEPIVLDASASTPGGCPGPLAYRFLAGATLLRSWDPAPVHGPFPAAATTTYTVEARCAARVDCVGTAARTVDVLAAPRPRLGPPPLLCLGGAVTLDAAASDPGGCPGPLEYRFREGAAILQPWGPASSHGPLLPPLSTTYSVDLRCAALPGCAASGDLPVTVAAPPVALAGAPVAVCENDPARLDGSGSLPGGCPAGLSYEWWEGAVRVAGPSPSPLFSPPTSPRGTRRYTLRVECAGLPGCGASDEVTVTVRDCTIAVVWLDASARLAAGGVEIRWTTAKESGTLGFSIERMLGEGSWAPVIPWIDAHGAYRPYRAHDPAGRAATRYRIVEQTDLGGGDLSGEIEVEASLPRASPRARRRAGPRR